MRKPWQSGYIKARDQAAMDMPVGDPFSGPAFGDRHDVGSIVGGVTALGGALFQGMAAEDAEDAQYEAANRANDTQRYFYDTTRADNLPFLKAGYEANDLLKALMSSGALSSNPSFADYQKDPSYGFQQSEALKAVQGSAAARGGLYSGPTMKAIADRSQNIANADYGNWWNRNQQGMSNRVNLLNAIRSGGQAAAGAIGAAGQNAGNQISGNLIGQGNATASERMAQGSILANTLNRFSSYGGGKMFGM